MRKGGLLAQMLHKTIDAHKEELRELRRYLHTIPEESLKEYKTSKFIYSFLQDLKPDQLECITPTGIKAVFLAPNPKKTVAIRADIDALPIEEPNGSCPFVSQHKGMMHACGHDGHITIALITAKIISAAKNNLKCNYVFLFQPAEEKLGGAQSMIEHGALINPRVDEIYGLHLWPYLQGGTFGLKTGALMASMCDINITILGRGSHGARPQQGIDAIVAASQFINGIQTIISRNTDPFTPAVITIGKISGGTTHNVICEEVHLEGTVRTFEENVKRTIKNRLQNMLDGIEQMHGVRCTTKETMAFPAVVNDQALYEAACVKLADHRIEFVDPVMMSEDFSYFQQEIPGLYAFLGIADELHSAPLHSNEFDFDECWLQYGVDFYLRMTNFE